MSISAEEVAKVARLARLRLAPEEVGRYQDQLGRILDHMEELRKLDTSGVEPTAHVLGLSNVLREDEARAFPEPRALADAAPEREGPYVKVPKVIE